MRAPPPAPDGAASSTGSPTSRALAFRAGNDPEAALRIAAGVLARDDAGAVAALIIANLLGQRGATDRSGERREALDLALQIALNSGDFALASAAAIELRSADDQGVGLDKVAKMFCHGASRAGGPASPPPMPTSKVEPLPDALEGEPLLDAVTAAVRAAKVRIADRRHPAATPAALFSSLGYEALFTLLGGCSLLWSSDAQAVIEEGAPGEDAYLVVHGELEVQRSAGASAMVLARLGRGAFFGEMALFARAPRAATVLTRGAALVLRIPRAALDVAVDRYPDVGVELARHCRARMIENLRRTSPVLAVVPAADQPALLDRFETRIFEARERLIAQGAPSPGLYVIASGKVTVVRREEGDAEPLVLAQLGPGDVVGEVALVLRRRPGADVVAAEPVVTLFLPASGFLGLIHDHPAMLAELYLLAAARDEETSNVISQEATAAEDFILV